MQAKTNSFRTYAIPVAIVVAIGAVLVLSSRTPHTPTGDPIIISDSDYHASKDEALRLALEGVTNFNMGVDITDKEKADMAKAARIFDNMDRYKPEESAGFFEAGLLYYLIGDSDTALLRVQQSLNNAALTPKMRTPRDQANMEGIIGDCYQILSKIAFERQNYSLALGEADEALKHVSVRAAYYYDRANALVALKRIPEAKADLQKAMSLLPPYPPADRLLRFLNNKD